MPAAFASRYGATPDKFHIVAPKLREKYGDRFKEIPWKQLDSTLN